MPLSLGDAVAPPARLNGRARWAFGAKATVTLLLMAWLLRGVDWPLLGERLQKAEPAWLLVAFAAVCTALFLGALRWRWTAMAVGLTLPLGQAVRLSLIGLFFGQVLPASVGSDAVRAWLAYRSGLPIGTVVPSLLLDRLSGLIGLLGLDVVAAVVLIRHVAPEFAWAGLLAGMLMVGGGVAILMLNRLPLPPRLRLPALETMRGVLRRTDKGLITGASCSAMLLSPAVQALYVGAVLLLARSLGVPIGVGAGFAVVPIALTLASVPLSVNGWGVREGAMVAGLYAHGIGFADALLVSILLGLCMLLASLAGGVLWLARSPER